MLSEELHQRVDADVAVGELGGERVGNPCSDMGAGLSRGQGEAAAMTVAVAAASLARWV